MTAQQMAGSHAGSLLARTKLFALRGFEMLTR